jgi:hypothetical protein
VRKLIAFAGVLALLIALPLMAAAAAAGIEGKWTFVLNTEGGDRTAAGEFKLDGQKVTGKWGDASADVAGAFADGKLDLSFPYNSDEIGPGTMKIKGELAGDTITGTWEFQDYNGAFKATRAQ